MADKDSADNAGSPIEKRPTADGLLALGWYDVTRMSDAYRRFMSPHNKRELLTKTSTTYGRSLL